MSGFDPEAMIDAMSPALGLTIDAEIKPGVAMYLRVAERMARIVEAALLPDHEAEQAPVFRPGDVDGGS
jgi:hypothetical protein